MLKRLPAIALIIVLGLATAYFISPYNYFSSHNREARLLDQLVARNIAARGGAEAWRQVSSLRLAGLMDVGQEMYLPYVLEYKRPGMMCLEFNFDGETAVQCADGRSGWKIAPFRSSRRAVAMTEKEFRETADASDPYGLLYDYAARGISVELAGRETIEGRDSFKLKLTLPKGAVRWLYLDAETALEVKLETKRWRDGRERLVETFYRDWQNMDGLLMARRQDTLTEGDSKSHFLTVDSVEVNPPLDDAHFAMPANPGARQASLQQVSM